MSVNLKVTIGTVNYSGFLHITAAKVSAPSIIIWEIWIAMPKTNFNFIIPDLDPENYLVTYYNSADDSSLGTLEAQLLVNALTGEILNERRFYTCGGDGDYDPADGDSSITDPYLIGKNVTGLFKEAFRYYEPITEFTFDSDAGKVSIISGVALSLNEKISVEISYNTGVQTSSGGGGGLYNGTVTVTEAIRTLTTDEINARIRCLGTASTQIITACSLASIAIDKGYYFDNSVGGKAVQVKILFPGTDKLRFNGLNTSNILFSEFWVSRGEHLKIVKITDDNGSYWEVIGDYSGVKVGEKVTLGHNDHPNILCEEGQLIDGDEYPRLWWWIKNVLPATHYYITDTVTGSFSPDPDRLGQFAIHSTLKKFRMPTTRYMTERGLNNFLSLGLSDVRRPVNYPGGFQNEMIGKHTHTGIYGDTGSHGAASSSLSGLWKWLVNGVTSGSNSGQASGGRTGDVTGNNYENSTKNIGVIYARRI